MDTTDVIIKGEPGQQDVVVKGAPPGTKVTIVGSSGAVTEMQLPLSARAINFYAGAAPVPLAGAPPPPSPFGSQPPVVYEPLLSSSHDPCTRARLFLNVSAVVIFVVCGYLQTTSQAKAAGQWAALGGACWFAYVLISLYFSSDATALRNHMRPMELLALTSRLRSTAPVLWAEIVCFHYETRSHTTYKNGKATTHTQRVKVETHRAKNTFAFARWVDSGGPPVFHPELKLLEVFFEPVLDFADAETHGAYEAWKHHFYAANTRDVEQTRTAGMDIEGYKDFVLIQQGHFCAVNFFVYAFFVLSALGFVYEVLVFSRFPHTRYKLVKQVYVH